MNCTLFICILILACLCSYGVIGNGGANAGRSQVELDAEQIKALTGEDHEISKGKLYDLLDDNGLDPAEAVGAVIIDGYDSAIVGITETQQLVYDWDRMVDELVIQGVPYDDAVDHLEYNVIGSYLSTGDQHPVIMHRLEKL